MTITHVVTGAFGYTGKYIARRLLETDARVTTLTGHPDRPHPFGDRVSASPFNFDDPGALANAMRGADTLFNTYWIRFAHRGITHDTAVDNTRSLIAAAEMAGIRRIVHLSITNASVDSPLPYFRGKAIVEALLEESSVSHAILRPTVIFGKEDILLNNIAWLIRRFPLHPVFGDGDYQVQPISVEDLAHLAVALGKGTENIAVDAVGPEVFTYRELVRLMADEIGSRTKLIHVNPGLALMVSRLLGVFLRDVPLTRDEIDGLMGNLLMSRSGEPPTGTTLFSEWLNKNAHLLGRDYSSELDRHYR